MRVGAIRWLAEICESGRMFSAGGGAGAIVQAVEETLAVIETHVGDVPVFFFANTAENGSEGFDVG